MKKYIFLLVCGMCNFLLHSQTLSLKKKATTRAVVVGVSQYQNENIPDLSYGHRDAEYFVSFLKSKAGGEVPDENIKFLVNETATTAQIAAAMDWLMDESKEGDVAFIYFSGHGDVETKTKRQIGFFLTHDSPSTTYIAGAYPLFYLKLVLETLADNDVLTIMVSDACRAGKLAGSEIGGSQITSANLSQQIGNEIKIMSCQPNEYSLEGEQWGGGRGLFSYHLINGLMGLADSNQDKKITLLELRRYLEDNVPTEAAPQSQIPMIVGGLGTQLATVDDEILEKVKNNKADEVLAFGTIDTKGFDDVVLGKADSLTRLRYQNFSAAIDSNLLLGTDGESAHELYEILSLNNDIEPLHNIMRRNLAAALQDEAQQILNGFLDGDAEIVGNFYNYPEKFDKYPRYLQKAADLLGKGHYMHDNLIAKKLYFETQQKIVPFLMFEAADSLRIRNNPLRHELIHKLDTALQLEKDAAYIHYLMGVLHALALNPQDTSHMVYLNKALELSPKFLQPYMALSSWESYLGNDKQCIAYLKNALAIDPNHLTANFNMGIEYSEFYGDYNSSNYYLKKVIELDPNDYSAIGSIGDNYFALGDFVNAEAFYQKARNLAPDNPYLHWGLGELYASLRQFDKAFDHLKKGIEADSLHFQFPMMLGHYHLAIGQMVQAEQYLQKAKELKSAVDTKVALAAFYYQNKELQKAKAILKETMETNTSKNENMVPLYSLLAKVHWQEGKLIQAYQMLDKAIQYEVETFQKGWSWLYAESKSLQADFLMQEGKMQQASKAIEEAFAIYEHSEDAAFAKAKWFALQGQKKETLKWLEIALQKGWYKMVQWEEEAAFADIRKTKAYQKLMKEYAGEWLEMRG